MNLNKEKIKKNPIDGLLHDDLLRAEVRRVMDISGYNMASLSARLRELGVLIDKTRLSRYLSVNGEKNGLTDELLLCVCKYLGISVKLKLFTKQEPERDRAKKTLEYLYELKKIREIPKEPIRAQGPYIDKKEDF